MTEQPNTEGAHNTSWLPTGLVLEGRWRIEGKLGRGGFATVYHGTHVQLERKAAIKVLDIQAPPEELAIFEERFLREAKFAARMEHPCIVQIIDFGVTSQHGMRKPFLVMEKLSGHDLEHELLEHGPLEKTRAKRLFLQTLEALARCHDQGIVHRDLKPSNLFLSHPGTSHEKLVVLDFGIARAFEDPDSKLTATSHFTGTPAYLAPEYISEQHVSPALDVYQMGLIIGESLTGQPVVQASAPLGYLMAHCNGQQRLHPRMLDTQVGAILKRALSVDPMERPPTAGDLLLALQGASWEQLPNSYETSTSQSSYALDAGTEEGINPWARTEAASQESLQPTLDDAPIPAQGANPENLRTTTLREPFDTSKKKRTRPHPALLFLAAVFALGALVGGSILLISLQNPSSSHDPGEDTRPALTQDVVSEGESLPSSNEPAPVRAIAEAPEPREAIDMGEAVEPPPRTETAKRAEPDVKPAASASPPVTKRHTSATLAQEQFALLALTPQDEKLHRAHDALSKGMNAIHGTYLQMLVRIEEDGAQEAADSASFFLDVADGYRSARKSLDRSRKKAPPLTTLDRHSTTLAAQLEDLATLADASYTYRLTRDTRDVGAFPGLMKRWEDGIADFLPVYASWRQELFLEEERAFQEKLEVLDKTKSPLVYHYYATLREFADMMRELEETHEPGKLDPYLVRAKKHLTYLKEVDLMTYADQLDSTQRNAIHTTITALHRLPGHVQTYQKAHAKHASKDTLATKRKLASAAQSFLTSYSFTMKKHHARQGFD